MTLGRREGLVAGAGLVVLASGFLPLVGGAGGRRSDGFPGSADVSWGFWTGLAGMVLAGMALALSGTGDGRRRSAVRE